MDEHMRSMLHHRELEKLKGRWVVVSPKLNNMHRYHVTIYADSKFHIYFCKIIMDTYSWLVIRVTTSSSLDYNCILLNTIFLNELVTLMQELWLCFKSFVQMYLGHEARVHTGTCSSQLSGKWIYGQLSQLWHIYLDTISPEQQAWPIEGNWLSCDSHVDCWKYVACRWDGRIWSGANTD